MEAKVYNIEGKETGKKITLPEGVFGITPNEHAVYLDVKQYLANQRQGTHKSKERAEVARSTRKLKKQKGTGGARAGSLKSPLFKGGGRVFGPKPRDYSFKVNQKVKQLARKSVLSSKASTNQIRVVEDFSFAAPKTKDFIKFLDSFEANGLKSVLVTADMNKNVVLSGRNIPGIRVSAASAINTYDLVNSDILFIQVSAVEKINENLN